MGGYAAAEYAASLAEFGQVLALPAAGAWLLARDVPGGGGRDAQGCYPLTCCARWQQLPQALQQLPSELVSLSLVPDPAAGLELEFLRECFPDICYHYKSHFFADLSRPLASYVSSHHQRNVRQSGRGLRIEAIREPAELLADWIGLYGCLVKRHAIQGIAAFSPLAFRKLMGVPGLRVFAARSGEEIVGMILWLVSQEVAYYHLAAYSEAGYSLKASFALFWESLESLAADKVAWAALGGGAGTHSASQGLSRFKEGWSSESRPAYFCGRILDRRRFAELVAQAGPVAAGFFPAYRAARLTNAA